MNTTLRTLTAAWPWSTVDLLNHLWQSTVVGLVVLAVLGLGGGLPARTRRALGWLALVKFAVPTGFLVGAFARLGATPERWVQTTALTRPILLPAFVTAAPAADAPARVSVGLILMALWFVGFVALFVTWLVRSRVLRRQIFSEVQPVSPLVEQRLDSAAERTGLPATPRCLAVGSERAPGVLGVVAPVVIVPRGLEATLAPAELESVLIHEFVHVRRRDNLWSAVQAFFVSLFWFHPLVWLLNRRIGIETEQSCDERVVEITGDADTYAGGIVKAVRHALGVAQPGLIGATTPPVIARIKNIFSHPARRDRPLVRGAVLTAAALLIAFSGYSGSFAARSFAAPALAAIASEPTAPVAPAAEASPAPVTAPTAPPATALVNKSGDAVWTAPAAAAPAAPVAAPAEPTFSIDFPNEDIRRILRNVADLFQLNVVMPVGLNGKMTVKLRDVTWRQIFKIVLDPIGYTFVEDGNIVKIVPAESLTADAPAAAPVAIGSLTARAAEARLLAQADELKARAQKLQQEVEAYQAARAGGAETSGDPEAAAKAAAVAALDARRQAVDAATKATEDVVRLTEITAERTAQVEHQRALTEEKAKQQVIESERQRTVAANAKLPAPEGASTKPAMGFDETAVDKALADLAKHEEVRAQLGTVFEPGQLDRQPVVVVQPRPSYPFELHRQGVGGEVTVDFIVDASGNVVNAYALQSSPAGFEKPAVDAVSRWKFKPGRKSGRDVSTHMQVPIVFATKEK